MSCIGLGSQILHLLWMEQGRFTSLMLGDQQLLINPSQLELTEYNIVHKKTRIEFVLRATFLGSAISPSKKAKPSLKKLRQVRTGMYSI